MVEWKVGEVGILINMTHKHIKQRTEQDEDAWRNDQKKIFFFSVPSRDDQGTFCPCVMDTLSSYPAHTFPLKRRHHENITLFLLHFPYILKFRRLIFLWQEKYEKKNQFQNHVCVVQHTFNAFRFAWIFQQFPLFCDFFFLFKKNRFSSLDYTWSVSSFQFIYTDCYLIECWCNQFQDIIDSPTRATKAEPIFFYAGFTLKSVILHKL